MENVFAKKIITMMEIAESVNLVFCLHAKPVKIYVYNSILLELQLLKNIVEKFCYFKMIIT